MQRPASRARATVPQRDVDRADRVHDDTRPALNPDRLIHSIPRRLDRQRIAADDVGDEKLTRRNRRAAPATGADVARADSANAIVGSDLDHQVVALGERRRRRGHRHGERNAHGSDGAIGDRRHLTCLDRNGL